MRRLLDDLRHWDVVLDFFGCYRSCEPVKEGLNDPLYIMSFHRNSKVLLDLAIWWPPFAGFQDHLDRDCVDCGHGVQAVFEELFGYASKNLHSSSSQRSQRCSDNNCGCFVPPPDW